MDESDSIHISSFQFRKAYLIPFLLGLGGIIFIIIGFKTLLLAHEPIVEFKESTVSAHMPAVGVTVDIAGAIVAPGVYKIAPESRIQDALLAAGGLAPNADREWVGKYINLAAKALDGTKVYIPAKGEMAAVAIDQPMLFYSNSAININTATSSQLEDLPGIGAITAEKIIQARPYSSVEDLLSKKVVNKSTFEKIKDKISTY